MRILNGAHTSSVLAAHLSKLLRKNIFDEIIPSMDGDKTELTTYAKDVLERFANPYIRHLLLSISLNSVSKFKTRVLPSIQGYVKKQGRIPPALCFSLAALIAFYQDAKVTKDDADILEKFAALYQGADLADAAAAKRIAAAVLSTAAWWGEDLTAIPGLADEVAKHLHAIGTKGIKAAIADVRG